MNNFTKGFLKYFVLPVTTLGAAVGITFGVTSHFKDKKIDKAYDRGYNAAIVQQEDYKTELEQYKQLIQEQNSTIQQYISKVAELDKANKDKELQIQTLTDTVSTKETLISSLQAEVQQNESEISSLTTEITNLREQVATLTNDKNKNAEEIIILNGKIQTLQSNITSLQKTNEQNLSTIESLNTQIELLNTQILSLQTEINNNNLTNKQYTEQIEALEKSIQYYESYIANMENDSQVVATFMFDGSVYNLQIVNKGSYAVVTPPQSTEYKIFNYWMVGDVQTDPSTYALNESTTFVANITYKYAVLFKNDSATVDSQIVEKGQHPTNPSSIPQKDGYVFDGWTLNGVDVVDPTQTEIEHDTTFIAKWSQLHTVKFNDGQSDINTYSVKHGGYLNEIPTQPTKDNYQFDGWTLDGTNVVNPQSVLVLEDKTFIAKWTRLWTVTFSDGVGENTTYKVRDNEYLSELPVNPSKQDYEFDGWMKDGEIVSPKTVQIIEDTTFTAKWTRLWTVTFSDGVGENTTYKVRDNEYLSELPANPSKQDYEFDGWMKGGEIVSPKTVQIVEDTTFTAKWTRLWNVTFTYLDKDSVTYKVRDNETLKDKPTNASKSGNFKFAGWSIDGQNIVDLKTFKFGYDIVFVPVFKQTYHVRTSARNYDDTLSVEAIHSYAEGEYLNLPIPKIKGKHFEYWTLHGEKVDPSTLIMQPSMENTVFYAVMSYEPYGTYDITFTGVIDGFNFSRTEQWRFNRYSLSMSNPPVTEWDKDSDIYSFFSASDFKSEASLSVKDDDSGIQLITFTCSFQFIQKINPGSHYGYDKRQEGSCKLTFAFNKWDNTITIDSWEWELPEEIDGNCDISYSYSFTGGFYE